MQNEQNNTPASTAQPSTNDPAPVSLRLFNQPEILRQIDSRRIDKLLRWFADDFAVAGITIPDHEGLNGGYHAAVGEILTGSLPDRLRATLITLEAAASPQNQARL